MMWLWSPQTVFTNTKSQQSCLVRCNCCCMVAAAGERSLQRWWDDRDHHDENCSLHPPVVSGWAPLNWFLWSWQWRVERGKRVASCAACSGNRCEPEQLMTFSTLFLSLNTPINYGSLRIISHVSGIGLSLTMTTVIIVMMTFTDRDRHGNPALCHLKLENITSHLFVIRAKAATIIQICLSDWTQFKSVWQWPGFSINYHQKHIVSVPGLRS